MDICVYIHMCIQFSALLTHLKRFNLLWFFFGYFFLIITGLSGPILWIKNSLLAAAGDRENDGKN